MYYLQTYNKIVKNINFKIHIFEWNSFKELLFFSIMAATITPTHY